MINSRQFQGHPLAPNSNVAPTLSITGPARVVVLWGDGTKVAEIGPAEIDAGGGLVEDRHYEKTEDSGSD